MSKRKSRRQWLLGLVGAVFGVSAAKAVDRWLPGKEQQQAPAPLTQAVVDEDSRALSTTVTRYDANGNVIDTQVFGPKVRAAYDLGGGGEKA